MERKEEILSFINNDNTKSVKLIGEIIDDFVFLEDQLKELRKLPQIMVNKENPALQKITPAAKLYKDYLIQYSNLIKIILSAIEEEVTDSDDSPISDFFKRQEEFFKKGMGK